MKKGGQAMSEPSEIRFDFVTDDALRVELESDYVELSTDFENKCWKSAIVMAGSMVETILLDWLLANGVKQHKGKAIEELYLKDMVEACKQKDIVSENPEHLAQVIQDFRNLIHPGRGKRLKQKVDKRKAEVSKTLLEMLVEEISKRKADKYGYTAEQIGHKIDNDPTNMSVLRHLIKDMKEPEKVKLLTKVLPGKLTDLYGMSEDYHEDYAPYPSISDRFLALSQCFRFTFQNASSEVKREAVANYIRIMKDMSAEELDSYQDAFFNISDLEHCASDDLPMALDYLFSKFAKLQPDTSLRMYHGIGNYLTMQRISEFAEVTRRMYCSKRTIPFSLTEFFQVELHGEASEEVRTRIIEWLRCCPVPSNPQNATQLTMIIENAEVF